MGLNWKVAEILLPKRKANASLAKEPIQFPNVLLSGKLKLYLIYFDELKTYKKHTTEKDLQKKQALRNISSFYSGLAQR